PTGAPTEDGGTASVGAAVAAIRPSGRLGRHDHRAHGRSYEGRWHSLCRSRRGGDPAARPAWPPDYNCPLALEIW
ncbi:hypothetical protein, partial [Litchfieldella qijiaojingensis]|uniref:hypothetical protein n=1 Tax=Litchfieldella qijiaojingensis TaxID=980347 RepID=UPI001E4E9247